MCIGVMLSNGIKVGTCFGVGLEYDSPIWELQPAEIGNLLLVSRRYYKDLYEYEMYVCGLDRLNKLSDLKDRFRTVNETPSYEQIQSTLKNIRLNPFIEPDDLELIDGIIQHLDDPYNCSGLSKLLPLRKRKRRVIPQRPNYLYFAQRDDGIYKIGHTSNLKNRLRDLAKFFGQQMRLICSSEFSNKGLAFKAEGVMKVKYKKNAVGGECYGNELFKFSEQEASLVAKNIESASSFSC